MNSNLMLATLASDLTCPSPEFVAVVPSNTVDLTKPCRGLYVGGAGDIMAVPLAAPGTAVLFKAVPAGTVLPIVATRVNATGTTATDIVALF